MSIGLPKGHTITLPVTGLSWPIPTFLPPASCRHPMGSATQQAANQKARGKYHRSDPVHRLGDGRRWWSRTDL